LSVAFFGWPHARVIGFCFVGCGDQSILGKGGLVFPHKDGGAFNIMLQAFPFDGKNRLPGDRRRRSRRRVDPRHLTITAAFGSSSDGVHSSQYADELLRGYPKRTYMIVGASFVRMTTPTCELW